MTTTLETKPKTKTAYDRSFYNKIERGSRLSAKEVVPYLIQWAQPKSVVDVGCGTGAWLAAFQDQGIEDILGIDGDYVDTDALLIPSARFMPAHVGQSLGLQRRFDLVISLEVAEHLPATDAETYVDNLVSFGDVIAFSAAIPNQGGTGHVNEQWPEYWKAKFEARGFVLVDCVRPAIWNNRDVESWYRQNLVLYVYKDYLQANPALKKEWENSQGRMLSVIHPAMYTAPSMSALLRMFSRSLSRAVRRRMGKTV